MGGDRVRSFGRSRPAEESPEPMLLPPIQLPPVRLILEIDPKALETLGQQINEMVYNAATGALLSAMEDFADVVDQRQAEGIFPGAVEPVETGEPIVATSDQAEAVVDPEPVEQ